MINSIIAISTGAAVGAVSRWLLGLALNSIFPPIPFGTLAANLIGGYCMGLGMGFFDVLPSISPEWRLFVNIGLLGALTTFSTFSAEVVALLHQGRFGMAAGAATLHLFGSIIMTFLGIATFTMLWRG
ncbi:MAG: fluoride efflux transporter CrcB [Holophagales bacterium]|jgi:CrcB protein|nr:fluoride efflux transporter CrcB [Holophagales bacterium]